MPSNHWPALLTARRLLRGGLASAFLWVLTTTAAWAEPPADNGAVVVMYHRFGENNQPTASIRLEQFEAHIAELASGRYNVRPLSEIIEALAKGRALPDRTLAITVDDAFVSLYAEGWPRLKAAGLPFTLFLSTEAHDRGYRDHMSWDQLRELVASGNVTIGSQGVGHGHMVLQPPAETAAELAQSRQRIAAELGMTPSFFAYPFGEYDLALRDLVAAAGFTAAFGQQSGAIGRTEDRLALPRFSLSESYGNLARFRLVASALPIPVVDVTPSDPRVTPANNPPPYGFTLLAGYGDPAQIACYGLGHTLQVERLGDWRMEVRLPEALSRGRSRINCTLPGPGGRWRWLGRQFYLPDE